MASRRFRRELSENLPAWQDKGWVTEDGAKALRETYQLLDTGPQLGPILRALFGALLIGGGLILLLAHNWDQLPRAVRVGFAFAPLLGTLGLGAWVLKRAHDRVAWVEGVALANSLCVALAISVVAQVYQISGDTPRFLLTWALLTLPAVFLLRSGTAWVLYQVLAATWAWEVVDRSVVTPGYLGLLIPSLLVFVLPSWKTDRPATVAALVLPLFLAVDSGFGATLREVNGYGWFWTLYFGWLGLFTLITSAQESLGGRWASWLARLGSGGLLLALTFDDNWRHYTYHSWRTEDDGSVVRIVSLLALVLIPLAGLLVRHWRKSHPTDRWWAALGLFGALVGAAKAQDFDSGLGALLTNVVAGALAAETMRRGLQERDFARLNLGWLLLSALILLRFFDSDWSYLIRGLVFIALGCGFFILNAWLRRRAPSP